MYRGQKTLPTPSNTQHPLAFIPRDCYVRIPRIFSRLVHSDIDVLGESVWGTIGWLDQASNEFGNAIEDLVLKTCAQICLELIMYLLSS